MGIKKPFGQNQSKELFFIFRYFYILYLVLSFFFLFILYF